MPYIKQKDREKFGSFLNEIFKQEISSAGELNYLLTRLVHKYIEQNPESYQKYNDAIGALEGAKLELYRRHISNYEDRKIIENGDVLW